MTENKLTMEKMIECAGELLHDKFNYGSDSPRFRWDKEQNKIIYCTCNYDWFEKNLCNEDIENEENFFKSILETILGAEYILSVYEDDACRRNFEYIFDMKRI